MIRKLTYILLCVLPTMAVAQSGSVIDFGAGLGLSSYYGDINKSRMFYEANLGLETFIRYNISSRYAIRGNLLLTKLRGDDSHFDNEYQKSRNANFNVGLAEIGFIGEVNFFTFENEPKLGSIGTIYALVGGFTSLVKSLGDGDYKEGKGIILGCTVGAGYKRNIGGHFGLEVEWAFRKCFSDRLDGVNNPLKLGESDFFNNDWYNFLGVKIIYSLNLYKGECRGFSED